MKEYLIASAPTISLDVFQRALEYRRSPVAPQAAEAYAICVERGVNPAVALGFFVHESNCGTAGRAVETHNWGNLRMGRGPRAVRNADGFAWYTDWLDGLRDFCERLRGPVYEGAGLLTVSQVVPKYAPPEDHNKPDIYIEAVNRLCAVWERMSGGAL